MKDRLAQFLNAEQITAGRFAESIGVQASSISHILSGRNNPGYDFLYKLFSTYPRLNPSWMIMGKGEMYIDTDSSHLDKKKILHSSHINIAQTNCEELTNKREKDIERIIVFYSDKTFDSYTK